MAAKLPARELAILTGSAGLAAIVILLWTAIAYERGVAPAVGLLAGLVLAALILYTPTAGACFAVLAAPVDYLASGSEGGFTITPSEAIVFLTALSAGIRLVTSVRLSQVPAPLYAFGALVVISAIGVFFATDTFVVTRLVLNWAAFGIVALYISRLPLRSALTVGLALALSGGVLGIMALGNISEQEAIAGGAIVANRAAASFAHPTSLALFLMMSFPLAFAFGLRGPRRLRAPMLAVAAVSLLGLALTQTRGAMIGSAVALLWMIYVWPPFRRLALSAIATLAVVFALDLGSVSEQKSISVLSNRLSTLTLNSTGDQRLEIWSTAPRIIADHPLLGVGQGNFPAVSPSYGLTDVGGLPFDHAHDLFLNVTAELGLPALMLLLFLIAGVTAAARRALRYRAAPSYPYAVAVSASLLGLLVNSITEYPLRQNLVMATIMIVIGILLALERSSRDEARSVDRD